MRKAATAVAVGLVLALCGAARGQHGGDVADAQERVAARMQQLEQRLLELTGQFRDREPERAGSIEQALAVSRERLIVARMESVRSLVSQGRYEEAAALQQRLIDDLGEVALALAADRAAQDVARLREIVARLDGLHARQAEALEQLRQALDAQAMAALADVQAGLLGEGRELLAALAGGPGAEAMAAAMGHMSAAAGALSKGGRGKALGEQQEALDALDQARAAVQQAIERMEDQLRARRRAGLRAVFGEMLAEQRAVRLETEMLVATLSAESEVTRTQRLRMAELATREAALVDAAYRAMALLDADGSTSALPAVLRQVRADVGAVAARLGAARLGPEVVLLEEDVEAALQALLNAVSARASDQPAPPDDSTTQRRRGRKASRLVGATAELKLLRALQVQVNLRTAQLEARRGDSWEQVEASRVQTARLAERQTRLASAVRELGEALRGEGP